MGLQSSCTVAGAGSGRGRVRSCFAHRPKEGGLGRKGGLHVCYCTLTACILYMHRMLHDGIRLPGSCSYIVCSPGTRCGDCLTAKTSHSVAHLPNMSIAQ